jgi:hypothetical protein
MVEMVEEADMLLSELMSNSGHFIRLSLKNTLVQDTEEMGVKTEVVVLKGKTSILMCL